MWRYEGVRADDPTNWNRNRWPMFRKVPSKGPNDELGFRKSMSIRPNTSRVVLPAHSRFVRIPLTPLALSSRKTRIMPHPTIPAQRGKGAEGQRRRPTYPRDRIPRSLRSAGSTARGVSSRGPRGVVRWLASTRHIGRITRHNTSPSSVRKREDPCNFESSLSKLKVATAD
jgi:hypothetical protein